MADDREPLLTSSSDRGYGSTTDDVKGLDLEELSDVTEDEKKMGFQSLVVLPIVFLYMFSFITALANMSQYGYHSIGKSMYPNQSDWENGSSNQCEANQSQLYTEQTRVQEATSQLKIYLSLAGGIPAIFANLIFGTFSDKFGRKFLFFLPAIGSFLRCVIVLIIMYLDADVYFFLIAFFIEGMFGYFLGMLQAGYAYMADITAADDKRTFAITLVEVSLGLGSFLGLLVSRYIIQSIGFMWTSVFSTGLLVVCLIMIMLFLPESVTSAQVTERRKCSDVIKYVGNALTFYFKRSPDRDRWKYIICISVFFLITFILLGRPSVETLLQRGSPFCWDPVEIGYYGTIRSGVQQVICLLLVKLLQYYMRDEAIAIAGTLSSTASLVMEGFVTTETSFYIVPVVGAGGVLTMPMVRAIMSKMTPADKQEEDEHMTRDIQIDMCHLFRGGLLFVVEENVAIVYAGAMFAGAAAFEAIGNMVSSVVANTIYNATVTVMQGLVFFVMAAFSFVSCLLLMLLLIIPQCGVQKAYTIQHEIVTV